MAKAETVDTFVILKTAPHKDGAIPMPEFRRACQRWAFENGLNPPSNRLITRVLREKWGVAPEGSRYEWWYGGIVWKKGCAPEK